MKTNQEQLDFYEVELGKRYKITKAYNKAFKNLEGREFEIKKDELFLNNLSLFFIIPDSIPIGISCLSQFDYKEVKPEILTDKEKEYLSAVIKPFRNRVVSVSKQVGAVSKREFIKILLYNEDHCTLPFFEPNQICKGMEANKWYTLEELGL